MDKILEIIVTLVGIGVTTSLTVYQLRRTISIRRARLKHDLEMLDLAKRLDIPAIKLQNRLEKELKDFVESEAALQARSPLSDPQFIGMTIYGIVVFIGFSLWTIYLLRDGFTWWSILTGLFALGGLMQPVIAWQEISSHRERGPASPNPVSSGDN